MRTFSITDFPKQGQTFGKYKSNTPGQAASKAFTKLVDKMGYDKDVEDKFIIFSIVEDDKNGHKKYYEYVGTRIKLHTPIYVNGRAYKHRNIVVSHSDNYFDEV